MCRVFIHSMVPCTLVGSLIWQDPACWHRHQACRDARCVLGTSGQGTPGHCINTGISDIGSDRQLLSFFRSDHWWLTCRPLRACHRSSSARTHPTKQTSVDSWRKDSLRLWSGSRQRLVKWLLHFAPGVHLSHPPRARALRASRYAGFLYFVLFSPM
jgi:hypothetical protein